MKKLSEKIIYNLKNSQILQLTISFLLVKFKDNFYTDEIKNELCNVQIKKLDNKMNRFLIFLFFFLSTSVNYLVAETVSITNGEWPPYLSKKIHRYGFGSHIVEESFRAVDLKVKWGFFPWTRSLNQTQKGSRWEAAALWFYTDERSKSFDYSEPVISISYYFFHLKSKKFNWKNLNNLKGLKIGITQDYSYGKEMNEAIKNKKLNFKIANKDELNILKLSKGRIDIFPVARLVGLAMIKKLRKKYPKNPYLAKITYHPKPVQTNPLYLLFSKNRKNKVVIKKFNQGLKQIKANGTYKKIMQDAANGVYSK